MSFLFLGTHVCKIFPEEVLRHWMRHLRRWHIAPRLCSLPLKPRFIWAPSEQLNVFAFAFKWIPLFVCCRSKIESKQIPAHVVLHPLGWGGNIFDGLFPLISALQEALNVKWLGCGEDTHQAPTLPARLNAAAHCAAINQLYHNTPPVYSECQQK